MAEDQTQDPQAAGAGAGGDQQMGMLPLQISPQYIKDISFESPNSPASIVSFAQSQPDIQVNVDVRVNPGENNVFEVILTLGMEAKHGEATDYLTEVHYGGMCTVGEVPENLIHAILFVEVPRLLFPFARQVLTNAVREAGFPPVMINPIDFGLLYKQRVEQMAAQQQAAAATNNGGTSQGDGAS